MSKEKKVSEMMDKLYARKPQPQGWEKEFDEKYYVGTTHGGFMTNPDGRIDGAVVKSFISHLLLKARQETLEEVLPKENLPSINCGIIEDKTIEENGKMRENWGFNSCRSQIIKTAQEKWGIKL